MEYLYGALIAWVIISWLFFILSETGCISDFTEDKVLWFLFAPICILMIITFPIKLFKFRKHKLSQKQFEEIKKCNFMYKQIGKNWWLCRVYGNKEKHPIAYHIILPMYIKVKQTK